MPTVPQLEAEAIAGIANAHTAIAPAKSKRPFFENFFMTNAPCESRQDAETNGTAPEPTPAYVSTAPQGPFNNRLPPHHRGSAARQTTTCS